MRAPSIYDFHRSDRDLTRATALKPYVLMHAERVRAHIKHADKPGGSMEMHKWDSTDWLPVLVEEVGEVAKVLCDHRHGLLDDIEMIDQLREELVQVGAMTAAWLAALGEAP